MSTNTTGNQPKIAVSLIDINNTGPGKYADDPAYVDFMLELHRTGLHVAESDGHVTIVGRLCDIRMERGEDGELFFTDVAERFMSDIKIAEDVPFSIDINVNRLLQWIDRTKFANRLSYVAWHDYLVLSELGPNGEVRVGTYHYTVLA